MSYEKSRPAGSRLVIGAALSILLCVTAAADDSIYRATIKRTSHGIAHIYAEDFGSLGFGEGLAQAEDHLCSIADEVIKVLGERARYFGPGTNNRHLNSDIGFKALQMTEKAAAGLSGQSEEVQEWVHGFAAGYNRYLQKTGKDNVPGWCRGADWVQEISAWDLAAYFRSKMLPSSFFVANIATATPPGDKAARAPGPELTQSLSASNGWAIGRDRSFTSRGMLVANPHYPWVGSNRFWEKHLVIPGILDIYGVHLIGAPGVAIGFNDAVAWTHTVSAGERYTLYSLDLVPGDPTRYRYDDEERAMTTRIVEVEVLQSDGSLRTERRAVYSSHYGPILNLRGMEWSTKRAISLRDAIEDNNASLSQWLAMGRARNMQEFKQAHLKGGMPWVNTIAASADGRAWYADTSSTPNLSDQALSAWKKRRTSDEATRKLWARGTVLLDGSDSTFEWVDDDRASHPGVVPVEDTPQLERIDYVFNANDSYWLSNISNPLTGFSPLHGSEGTARSLRTRMNAVVLSDVSKTGPAGDDARFTLEELSAAILNNRSMAAELLQSDLVQRCHDADSVALEGGRVNIDQACRILSDWDGTYNLDSVGTVLFREFITQYDPVEFRRAGNLFAVDFDPADPLGTPRRLAAAGADGDLALERLGRSARLLEEAGFGVDATLGDLQFSNRNGTRIPIHGGHGSFEGITNWAGFAPNTTTLEPLQRPPPVNGSRMLTTDGYPVTSGTSFLMVLEYTDEGPRAVAMLTYSQSGDPDSPLFSDQTKLFSKKAWRPVVFAADDIQRDPDLEVTVVEGSREGEE